ncbi:TonB-dependent receptor [Seongchinamella sediminis]|uniref:TonB-dependent receptor n=1 Tax=Seongchinamella sediminis TaxID=2283635 RepID=A0A3L7DY48_9GAMM|nr:TonB-dependent receptor [Seongchinamella sediminis]RLQ21113.1 TonB-dependent receptor [Seongchinamella sediminis]
MSERSLVLTGLNRAPEKLCGKPQRGCRAAMLVAGPGFLLCALTVALLGMGNAWGSEREVSFEIPPCSAHKALNLFAMQADIQILYPFDLVEGLELKGLTGRHTVARGLELLVAGTCLEVDATEDGHLMLKKNGNTRGILFMREKKCNRTGVFTALLASLSAFVANAEEAPSQQRATVLEEVLVTAQKREQSLQDTPIAITAFSANALDVQRITNVMDLANKVPSVSLVPWAGSRVAPNLFIRGMGNLNTQSVNDMATGIYLDGVPVGRGIGLATDFADLQRVEVLRGPQGTLWGRNTTAGAISFITKKPHDQLAGTFRLTAGNWDKRGGEATINAPLTDNLYARVGYIRRENDGWVENNSDLRSQVNFNEDRDKEAFKVAMRWEPTEVLTLDYGYDDSSMTYGNHFYQVVEGPSAVSGRQEKVTLNNGMGPSEAEISGHNLTLTWDAGAITVKSITAYRDLDSVIDMNFIDVFTQDRSMEQDQWSQELQFLGSVLDDRLQYVTGFFYIEEEADEYLLSSFAGGLLVDEWDLDAESTSAAIFGQATWTPPILEDRLDVTLGLRYTEDSRKVSKLYSNPQFTPDITGLRLEGDKDFDSTDPMLTLAYRFSDTVNGYAKYSTGYRAGGFNAQSTPDFFSAGFDQEEVDAYEIGLKSGFLDNRARLDVALFYNEYEDLQVDQARTPPVFVDTLNAGEVTIQGLEIEGSAVVTTGLSVNFYYAYLDAEYDSYIDGGVELADVRHVPNAPDWQIGAGMVYEFPPLALGELVLNIDYRAQDGFYAGPKRETRCPDYELWNARLELGAIPLVNRGNLKLAVWSQNFADEEYRLSTTNLGTISAQFGPPRSSGIDLVYEF